MARYARGLCATLALVVLCAALPAGAAQALPPREPDSSAFATNGKVNAVAHNAGTTYIGGEFTELRALTGTHARLDPTTGKRSAPSPLVPFGTTQVTIPDGAGGVYIGGGFSSVGTFNRHRVAHILADGTVDPNFNAPLFGGGGVNALAVADGALYVGGDFTSIGGTARNKIAKLSATSGNLFTTWNPNATHSTATPVVGALAVSGSELFVGGIFDNIGGLPREGIAKLSTASGNAFSAWNPDPEETVSFANPQIKELVVSGGNLYVGGLFSEIGTLPRNNIAKLSTVSGNAFSGWDPDSQQPGGPGTAEVGAIALSDDAGEVFVGGNFTSIGGQERNAIAKLSATSGNAFSLWNPNATSGGFQGPVSALAVSGDQVFAGGLFEEIGGLERPAIAKVSGTSGNAFSLFNVNPRSFGGTIGQIFTLAFSGGHLYAGGTYDTVNNVTRNRIAALDANGFPTAFNPNADAAVRSLAFSDDGSELFAGGEFTSIGGQPRDSIAKLSPASGNAFSGFDPNAGDAAQPSVNVLEVFGDIVYAGGDFGEIGGQNRDRLAKLSATSGNAFSAWDPSPDGAVFAIAASDTGGEVFVGGDFTNIGTLQRPKIAKLSATSGNAFSAFHGGDIISPVRALEVEGGEVYVGGDFTNIGGQVRRHLAKVSATSGNAFSAWNPDVDGRVNTIDLVGSVLYAGGEFSSVSQNTLFRSRLAAFSTTSGNPFSWDPTSFGEVNSLAATPTSVHVGESFNGPNLFLDRGYAQFTGP